MTREAAIENLFEDLSKEALVITSTGKISREAWEVHQRNKYEFGIFPMMGSMGCALSIGLGVALHTDKPVYILDGDGAFLMKMGSVVTWLTAHPFPINLHHIILNNESHDSTGGQRTGFWAVKAWISLPLTEVVEVDKGSRPDLGRPTLTPQEIKEKFCAKVRA